MDNYVKPKVNAIIGIIAGALGVFFLIITLILGGSVDSLSYSGLSSLSAMLGEFRFFIVIYYLFLIAMIALCILSVIRFVYHNSDKSALINAIVSGVGILMLLLGHGVISFFSTITNGSYLSSIYGSSSYSSLYSTYSSILSSYQSAASSATFLGIAPFLGIATLVINILVMLNITGNVHIGVLDPNAQPVNQAYNTNPQPRQHTPQPQEETFQTEEEPRQEKVLLPEEESFKTRAISDDQLVAALGAIDFAALGVNAQKGKINGLIAYRFNGPDWIGQLVLKEAGEENKYTFEFVQASKTNTQAMRDLLDAIENTFRQLDANTVIY